MGALAASVLRRARPHSSNTNSMPPVSVYSVLLLLFRGIRTGAHILRPILSGSVSSIKYTKHL